jgi:type IV secretory pathway VirB4 component
MAYEIPQQLEHKEKIMFGLTFPQLGWAFLFGLIALFILLREGNIYIQGGIALIIASVGLVFVFGDVLSWCKWILNYLKRRKVYDSGFESILAIKKIEDNAIFTKRKVAMLEIQPLNFRIKTEQEKESVITAFQKLLNSFDFPFQFVVTTQHLTIDNYLEALKKRVKDKKLFKGFQKFILSYIKQHQMRNRRFYIVIPDDGNLDIQCEVTIERLKNMGLLAKRLHESRLINDLNVFFNSKQVQRSHSSHHIADILGLKSIETDMNHFKVNETFCRVISASGYPRSVDSGFLDRIISLEGDFDISIHVEPFNIHTMMVILNKELQKQRADIYSDELKGAINPSLEIKYKDTRHILEELQKGEEKLFMVSLYINCKAPTLKELDLLTKKVESELNSAMIQPHVPLFRQLDGYRAMMPISENTLGIRRNVPTKALSAFFPFTSPFLQVETEGVMLGLNRNKVPVIRDIFALSNPNGLVLATSGAGKSYFTKLLILRQIMNGTKVIIIDPQSEYLGLVKEYKGQVITISRTSKTMINPLDLMGHDFLEKRLSLMDLFKIMFGDLTDVQKSILDKALTECYKQNDITVDSYKGKKPPILKDLYKTLEKMSKTASSMEQITYSALLNRLYVYTSGVFNFLNRPSSINFNADLVCFNIGDMPKQVKPVVMFLILDYVYMKMKQSKERKMLIIDEAWSLLSQTSEASYIFEIVKTCRKFNMGLLLITQDVADLIDSRAGHAVLANSAYSLLLRQKPAIINDVSKAFSLSKMEREYLLSATRGSGILITDNDHTELSIVASDEEHRLITTQPVEVKVVHKIAYTPVHGKEKDYYLDAELNNLDANHLFNNGYEKGEFCDIGETHKKKYWVKKRGNESAEHAFHVAILKRELQKRKIKFVEKVSVDADVVVEHRDEMFAFEIETGKSLKKHKNDKRDKFLEKYEEYGDNLYILFTNASFKPYYKNLIQDGTKLIVKRDIPNLFKKLFSK